MIKKGSYSKITEKRKILFDPSRLGEVVRSLLEDFKVCITSFGSLYQILIGTNQDIINGFC